MIELKCFNPANYGLNEETITSFMKMLEEKNSIIKTIVQTCTSSPEQYDCFDEYDNQVAYFRLRYSMFTVDCPNYKIMRPTEVFSTEEVKGFEKFQPEERVDWISKAIDAVDHYYNEDTRFICVAMKNEGKDIYGINGANISTQKVYEKLHMYEETHFLPWEVMQLRMRGPAITYKEAIVKLIKEHRYKRGSHFPEANGRDGLSDEHIEIELEYFKTTIDGLGGYLRAINWLYGKTFEEFEEIFCEKSKEGWNAL